MISGWCLSSVYAVKVYIAIFLKNRLQLLVVTLRLQLQCLSRRNKAKFAFRRGDSLRRRMRYEKPQAIAVALPWFREKLKGNK